MSIAIGLLLSLALLFTTIIMMLQSKEDALFDELNEKKVKMIIEGTNANMYDSRVSMRSLENIVYNSVPSAKVVVEELLNKIGKTPDVRYNQELLGDANKRNIHVERFNSIVDHLNNFEPLQKRKIRKLNKTICVLHFFEVLSISAAILCNFVLVFQ